MKLKDVLKKCSESQMIELRNHGEEIIFPNVQPYSQIAEPYLECLVDDYWRDGDVCCFMIIVLR